MGDANACRRSGRRRGRRGERRAAWALALGALVAVVGALAASTEAERASCDGQTKGVSCRRKPEKCLTWRKAQFIESFPAFDDSYFIRKLYKCNRDPRKSRCCWADAGMNYIGVDESAAESTVSSEDAEALPGITCENPQRLANGSWTDLKLNVVGDFEEVDLYEGNYSFPIYGDADPPAACTFLISNIRYQLDDEQGSSTLPSMGVVDLSSPRKGRCNRYPNKDTCACNTDDGSCPGVCLQLKRHFECQHCTRQECAAFCDGDFSCAAMEYQNSTEMCWMLYRPGYIQNVDLTDLGAGVSENVPSFTYAQPLSVPPPIESGSARSGIDCYGRSPDAALDTRSVEVVDDDGNGGRCAISDASQRVQRCGSYFPHMGQCGPAECASLCRQDPLCRAHEYNENFNRGQCFSIFEEPSGVVEGTTGTYRCFAVDRSVDTYDSDWFHDYRNHGFRDLSTEPGGVPIDLYDIVGGNPGATTQLASRPTASPTESPTAKKAGRGPCSLNSKRGRCCHAISSSRRRCCKGKIETTEGRQCCTIVARPNYDKIAKCCSKYTINGETYRDCVSNPSTSSGEYAAIIRTFT